jgi:hypothetical protein
MDDGMRFCRQPPPPGQAGGPLRDVAQPEPVPPLAEGFTDRRETAPGLASVLRPGSAVALVPGSESAADAPGWLRSCGKTQLAAQVARSLRQSRAVELLTWVTASSRASVLSGYIHAAAAAGLDHGGDGEVVAARFLAWLAETNRPWLMVLDDLRSEADVEGLWPHGPSGRLLITAAGAAAVPGGRQVQALPVPVFSMREAVAYLFGRLSADPDQRGGAIDLAAGLGCEPAAAVTWILSAEYAAQALPGEGVLPTPSRERAWSAVQALEQAGLVTIDPDHPDTLAAQAGLAEAYDADGQLGAALQERQQACAGYERALGADHPQTLTRRAELARAYQALGQIGDAVTLLRELITRSQRTLPPRRSAHPGTTAGPRRHDRRNGGISQPVNSY